MRDSRVISTTVRADIPLRDWTQSGLDSSCEIEIIAMTERLPAAEDVDEASPVHPKEGRTRVARAITVLPSLTKLISKSLEGVTDSVFGAAGIYGYVKLGVSFKGKSQSAVASLHPKHKNREESVHSTDAERTHGKQRQSLSFDAR